MQQVAPQPQQPKTGFPIWKMIILYLVVTQIFNFFKKPNPSIQYMNVIESGQQFDMQVTINSTKQFLWKESDLTYDTSDSNLRMKNFTITAKEILLNPYITAFVNIKTQQMVFKTQFKLCDYRKLKKVETKNLMFDAQEEYLIKKPEEAEQVKVLHVKNTGIIQFIHDSSAYPIGQLPPQLFGKYEFYNSSQGLKYRPYIDVEHYRLRIKDYLVVEDVGVAEDQVFQIPLEFNTYNYWKFLMTQSLQDSGKTYEKLGMENIMDEGTQDQFKEMMFETNLYLFVITMIVSCLHTVFSTLAIKNDIQYWKNLEQHQGISVRMLYQMFFIELIITLYLFDNETSKLILVQSVVELALMVWKIMKTTKFLWRADGKFPFIELKHKSSYSSTTEEHDKTAAKYLYMALLPMFICYLIYSLFYEEHKGWYSFFLSSGVGFIYIFGFINMTPQLYINYKLKSVAHLPWRMMIYKFLNTIIDDLFAFIITMPWLKRLSCFRDDIIFIIMLYQRRIYRVDLTRHEPGIAQEISQEKVTESIEDKQQHQKID